MFNTVLTATGIAPADVRLIRHKDSSALKGRSIYELWRDERIAFDLYQSLQDTGKRATLTAPYWAVFVVNASGGSMFVGLYDVHCNGLLATEVKQPHTQQTALAGSCDSYHLRLDDRMKEFVGKLFIDWGKGALVWAQHASRNDKAVTEIRPAFQEDEFPGFSNFIESVSRLSGLPATWVAALKSGRGVYLLTCPRTNEQYVGSATGAKGFWGRWEEYSKNGHGENLGLKSRDPSDYQVSILELAGTSASPDDIGKMEGLWQRKLQSVAMGLNRNLARV